MECPVRGHERHEQLQGQVQEARLLGPADEAGDTCEREM